MALYDEIKHQDWTAEDRQAGRKLSFNLFNGRVYVQVRDTKASFGTKPLFRRSLSWPQIRMLERTVKSVMTGSPENKQSIQGLKYDAQSHQSRVEWVITFEKDAKQVFRIHCSDTVTQRTEVVPVKGSKMCQIGSTPTTDNVASSIAMEELLSWIQVARNVAPFTIRPNNNQNFGNRSSNGGGAAPAAEVSAPAGGGDDGGLPF